MSLSQFAMRKTRGKHKYRSSQSTEIFTEMQVQSTKPLSELGCVKRIVGDFWNINAPFKTCCMKDAERQLDSN